jgi:hypothetical protein
MPPVGFEPTISEGERPQTYALDRAAIGTGIDSTYRQKFVISILTVLKIVIKEGDLNDICIIVTCTSNT